MYKKKSRPLVLFGFEGQKYGTLLENKVHFKTNCHALYQNKLPLTFLNLEQFFFIFQIMSQLGKAKHKHKHGCLSFNAETLLHVVLPYDYYYYVKTLTTYFRHLEFKI